MTDDVAALNAAMDAAIARRGGLPNSAPAVSALDLQALARVAHFDREKAVLLATVELNRFLESEAGHKALALLAVAGADQRIVFGAAESETCLDVVYFAKNGLHRATTDKKVFPVKPNIEKLDGAQVAAQLYYSEYGPHKGCLEESPKIVVWFTQELIKLANTL